MSATIDQPANFITAQQARQDDAEKALEILLAGLPPVNEFVRQKLREAYLLGRMVTAAENLDSMIKRIREQAR